MNRKQAKVKIVNTLRNHSVIIIPGLQKHRAKCYCGFTAQGSGPMVKGDVLHHQADQIIESLFGAESEIVEED